YTPGQRKVLGVKPGLTDYASIAFFRENDILGRASDPEKTYIEVIMPEKIRLNMHFIDHPTISSYFSVLGKTILRWVRGDRK
ncbi:MAG: sugar transferase, partial [Bacteroidota bacterium]